MAGTEIKISTGGIQTHEPSLFVSPRNLGRVKVLIEAGGSVDQAIQLVGGMVLPHRIRINSEPEVATSIPVRTAGPSPLEADVRSLIAVPPSELVVIHHPLLGTLVPVP